MYNALTGENTGTYEQYIAQNGYMDRGTYEGTRALRGDQIPWQDQLRNSMILPPSTNVQEPVAAQQMSMIQPSVPYTYNVPNEMGFLQNPAGLLANSQFANTPNNNLGAARFIGLLGAPINYSAPSNAIQNNYQSTYQPSAFQTSNMYKLGSALSTSNNPIFSFIGNDMMSSSPIGNYTSTPTTNTQGK
jgi:hypothetical protein